MNVRNLFQGLAVERIACDHPINYFDVGSRGGFQDDLHPLAFAVNAIGFEPEPSEFTDLTVQSGDLWKRAEYLPFGVSGQGGRRTLYVPRDPQSASLLRHNESIGARFDKRQFFEIENTIEIETRTLADALERAGVQSIDYLKIDIEGAEMEVIGANPSLLDDMLAVKTEVSFLDFRHGQPLAREVDQFMCGKGYMLMDLTGTAHWRRQGYVIHPYTGKDNPPYSKGQIMQGDYLYFRDPETLEDDPEAYIKLALIAMAFGYFDTALMVLEKDIARQYVFKKYGKTILEIISPASKKYGRKVFWAALYSQFRGLVPLLRYA